MIIVKDGIIVILVKDLEKDEKNIYEMYYEYIEVVKWIVFYCILVMNRGEKDGILKVSIDVFIDCIFLYLYK